MLPTTIINHHTDTSYVIELAPMSWAIDEFEQLQRSLQSYYVAGGVALAKITNFIRIVLHDQEEYLECKDLLRRWCSIKSPTLEIDFQFIERIGQGAQATVDLYKTRPSSGGEVLNYAVKNYHIQP